MRVLSGDGVSSPNNWAAGASRHIRMHAALTNQVAHIGTYALRGMVRARTPVRLAMRWEAPPRGPA